MKMPHISVVAALLFFASSLAVLSGCESDPLLAPQYNEENAKGSYGFTTFPGAETSDKGQKPNPELF